MLYSGTGVGELFEATGEMPGTIYRKQNKKCQGNEYIFLVSLMFLVCLDSTVLFRIVT